MLRNKLFAIVFCVAIFAVMISAPAKMFLTNAGIVKNENVGNIIEVEKVYAEGTFGASFFNAVEEAKRDISDIYTNYVPFYVGMTSAAESFKQRINQPVSSYLLELGNRIMAEGAAKDDAPDTDPTEEEIGTTDETTTDTTEEEIGTTDETITDTTEEEIGTTDETITDATEDETGTEDEITTPTDEPEVPAFETIYNTYFLKTQGSHRYYEITAITGENDPLVDFYIRVPTRTEAKARPAMQMQVNSINKFAAQRPDVNWYVFPVTAFEDTELCNTVLLSESKSAMFNDFLDALSPRIQHDYIKITDIRDRERLFFKTDHHWNVYGYTEGYRLITEMFKKNYPDIEARTPTIYTFDDQVTLYGASALAVANYKLHDVFYAADYHLPEHDYVIETGVSYGGTESIQQSIDRYLNKQNETSRSYNHYIRFYPITKEITYPQNNTGRNLLIIGDSYSPPLLEVLASHFDKTYVRYVDSNTELPNVKYTDLVDKYGITDVLMLELSSRVVFNYYFDSLRGLE